MMLRRFSVCLLFIFSLFSSYQAMADCENWRELSPTTSPVEATGASMAFDPCSGNLVLFGGTIAGTASNQTWIYDGTTWTQLSPATSPSARQGASMVFDPCLGKIVLFGGAFEGSTFFQDTWTFDGMTWTDITPVSGNPDARSAASMVFDPCIGKVVLFGGAAGSAPFNDTWTFDGLTSTWTELTTTGSPSIRAGASMVFNPCLGKSVLFGGANAGTNNNETWTFDGLTSTWVQLMPSSSPDARTFASMTFDPCNGQVVLFGGFGGSFLNDTWAFDGTDWTQLTPTDSPGARFSASMEFFPCTGQIILFGGGSGSVFNDTWSFGISTVGAGFTWDSLPSIPAGNERNAPSMAFNPCIGKIVLFGGTTGSGPSADTWTFDGTTWTDVSPMTSPDARTAASMVFDPCSGRMILYGGILEVGTVSTIFNDTWAFDGTDWMQLSPTASPTVGRFGASMEFDPCIGKIVLFGGDTGGTVDSDETWTFDGTTWTQLSPASSPAARQGASMAFDPCIGKMVLFGGYDGSFFNDTWTFDGVTWAQLSPAGMPTLPPARFAAPMAFDPCIGKTVLFGGGDFTTPYFNDTWTFDGTTWELLTLASSPPARLAASMAFDPCIGKLVLFGGSGSTGLIGVPYALNLVPMPIFTSVDNASFTVGSPGSFMVTVCGDPAPSISSTALPSGLTFTDNGGGMATIAGTPSVSGIFNLVFTASNMISDDAIQNFTLTVDEPLSIISPSATTFVAGMSNTFFVQTSGFPFPSIVESGALPPGVTFMDNGNGSATLSGTPAAGTGGTYSLTFTASNGVSSDAIQIFTLTVIEAPTITSANSVSFPVDSLSDFTVTATGFPNMSSITISGDTLPAGVTFSYMSGNTATLEGTPASLTAGTYNLMFTASNGVLPNASQNFTLTVTEGPQITSDPVAPFFAGTSNSFMITTSGVPAPSISISGTLPSGVSFVDNGDGTATLSGNPPTCSGGLYNLVITASNGILPNAVQNFTLGVGEAPTFISSSTATFVVNGSNTFLINTCGFNLTPTTITLSGGTLPPSITFTDNGDGTATLSGIPPESAEGDYSLEFTAQNGLTPDGTQSFILKIIDLLPPSNLQGIQVKNVFPTQTEFVNVLTWQPPQQQADSIASYRIYRDSTLQKLVARVKSNKPLRYEDHNRAQGVAYTYYIVSVDSGGSVSDPVSITIGG